MKNIIVWGKINDEKYKRINDREMEEKKKKGGTRSSVDNTYIIITICKCGMATRNGIQYQKKKKKKINKKGK